MTQQTITAIFDKREEATRAVDDLVQGGIPRTSIKLMPENDVAPAPILSTGTTYDTTRDEKGFWATLGDLFMPDEDRSSYAEAMHRGSIMVSVAVDEAHAARAEDILEEHGTVNMDEREASWRNEGWKGYSPTNPAAAGIAATARTGMAGTPARAASAGSDETISLVEEQLKIGKRQVSGGRVKVRSYVVETPVNEQVSLQDETVSVERRPIDRALTEAEAGRMFQDRTIEAEERDEEAVVSKSARVTGEVIVKKGVEQRTETARDSVRSTKVDVEDDRTGRPKDAQRP
jgi:uncharacterized protein (TIGR02271 family)